MTLGPFFKYKNVFIRTFIYNEINIFGLPKLIKICFAFHILSYPCVRNDLFKGCTKNHSNGRFCVGNHRSKNVSKEI